MQRDAARSIMRIKGFSGNPGDQIHFLSFLDGLMGSKFHRFMSFLLKLGEPEISNCGFCRFETCHPPSRNLFEATLKKGDLSDATSM